MKYFIPLLLAVVAVCAGCGRSSRGGQQVAGADSLAADTAGLSAPRYARGFSVRTLDGGIRYVCVDDPQRVPDEADAAAGAADEAVAGMGRAVSFRFLLVPRSADEATVEAARSKVAAAGEDGAEPTVVRVPIGGCITMTALQLSNLTALDARDVVRGITGTKNLYDEEIRRRVADGRVVRIGMEGNFDAEKVMAAQPDVIFISPFKRGGYESLKETGVTLVPHLGYKELTPLGQAEWMKFVAMFVGKEREADSLFRAIETRYNGLRDRVAKAVEGRPRPTVFSGEMHGGNWFAVGGKNYLAQMFEDAGADYILRDDPHSGGVPIDYETMYAQAAKADYWRILNSYHGTFSYDALRASNARNADFRAFRQRHVIYCNMKERPYYELTPVEPDVVLADLVAIFHPDLMPADYVPRFYELLR